jgi:hypothetical protein
MSYSLYILGFFVDHIQYRQVCILASSLFNFLPHRSFSPLYINSLSNLAGKLYPVGGGGGIEDESRL